MAIGVDENKSKDSAFESEEFIVPEFGRVNLSWFDFSRNYRGAIFRLAQDASKQISEIAGFSANFELPGIRTACLDLFKTEGFCLLEIERNTKPTDLAVRYSRERWNMTDASSKAGDNLRPWIKTEYRAQYIAEKVIGLVAEQLRVRSDKAANFVIRVNFKEKTFALIGEERFVDQMPTGGFSAFSLPTEPMISLAKKYGKLGIGDLPENADFESDALYQREGSSAGGSSLSESLSQGVSVGDSSASATPASIASANDLRVNTLAVSTASASNGSSTGESSTSSSADASATDTEASSSFPKPDPDSGLPGLTKAQDSFIQRKSSIPEEQNEQRRETVESTSAKYATYSRSEVDHMLKQQVENITNALGTKISSQQRVFQEAVEKQEKSFAKLSDKFVFDFDQTRVRLENSSKQSEDTIHNELESFKRDLSKELEQYRAQINKTVVPVAKFIEDRNNKPPEKVQKEVSQPKGQQSQLSADYNGLRTMLIVNIVLVALTVVSLLMFVVPSVWKIEELQSKLDSINAKLTAPVIHASLDKSLDKGDDKGSLSGSGAIK